MEIETQTASTTTLPASSLKDALYQAIKARGGRTHGSTTRIDEEDMYAALLKRHLDARAPGAGTKFSEALASAVEKIKARTSQTMLFKASDRVMRALVRSGDVSQDLYREAKEIAFGKAQLDEDRAWIGSDPVHKFGAPVIRRENIQVAIDRAEAAPPATFSELAKFRERESGISKEKRAAGPRPTAGTEGASPRTDEPFLWKPTADKDGKLVILLPASETGDVSGVSIRSSDGGKVLERGRYSGIGNGEREHYRFEHPGSYFESGVRVVITYRDGGESEFRIDKPAERLGE
jgi:hypothetical protein